MTEQLSTHTHNTLLCALHAKSLQLRPTFCQPMDCSPPALLSMGFSRQEYWSGLPFPPPGDLPDPGAELASLMSPAFVDGIFTTSTTWEAHVGGTMSENSKNGFQTQVGHWESKAGLLGGSG